MTRILFLIVFSFWISTCLANGGFTLSEHLSAGQQILLKFDVNNEAEINTTLHLPNGLALSFANLLSFGDLYGVLGQPISLGKTSQERQTRFLAAFATIAEQASSYNEAIKLNQVIENELAFIEEAIKNGEEPAEAFKKIANETGRQVNCITGGGCGKNDWWLFPGRYLKLAIENYDHFNPTAQLAYEAGHQAAILQAVYAHHSKRREDLELAYAMDAFACHFISDLFAAGHIRTPRNELKEKVTPSVVGSLLAHYMHDEENNAGLHVHNDLDQHWEAYGDTHYFNAANNNNRVMLNQVLQQSANDIFNAFYQGEATAYFAYQQVIPQSNETENQGTVDISPLFYWDKQSGVILRRQDLSNLYDRHWTSNWWGWSTLIALRKQYGIQPSMQLLWQAANIMYSND